MPTEYSLEVVERVDRTFEKLQRKDPVQFNELSKKIEQILENPHQFKPLRAPMQHMWRVHVGSYVLIYDINEDKKVVTVRRYEHHDAVYI
jgi:YafQ family addiction module toxin component